MTPPTASPDTAPAPLIWLWTRVPALRWPLYFAWRLADGWGLNGCPLKAAAMAFFGLLSVFPVALAAVAVLARFLSGDAAALHSFQSFVTGFFPGPTGRDVSNAIETASRSIAGGPDATTLGLFAITSLLWSGRAYFDTLASVLNDIWPGASQRSFWGHQRVLWSLFLGAGVLWLLSTAATFFASAAVQLADALPGGIAQRLPLSDALSRAVSFTLTTLMFYLLYRFLPHVEMKRRSRLIWGAALLAALAWEASKWGFARFMGNVARYEKTYGSVASVVVTLLWIYFSSMIILLGAQAAAAYEETCQARGNGLEAKP